MSEHIADHRQAHNGALWAIAIIMGIFLLLVIGAGVYYLQQQQKNQQAQTRAQIATQHAQEQAASAQQAVQSCEADVRSFWTVYVEQGGVLTSVDQAKEQQSLSNCSN